MTTLLHFAFGVGALIHLTNDLRVMAEAHPSVRRILSACHRRCTSDCRLEVNKLELLAHLLAHLSASFRKPTSAEPAGALANSIL